MEDPADGFFEEGIFMRLYHEASVEDFRLRAPAPTLHRRLGIPVTGECPTYCLDVSERDHNAINRHIPACRTINDLIALYAAGMRPSTFEGVGITTDYRIKKALETAGFEVRIPGRRRKGRQRD